MPTIDATLAYLAEVRAKDATHPYTLVSRSAEGHRVVNCKGHTPSAGQNVAQIFYRTFNRKTGVGQVCCVTTHVAHGAPVATILAAGCMESGVALLSRYGQIGVYEIQTDEGIWSHPGEAERCVLTKGVEFKTWDQLDREDP